MSKPFLVQLIESAPENYGILPKDIKRLTWQAFIPGLFSENWDELTLRERAIVAIFADRLLDDHMDNLE